MYVIPPCTAVSGALFRNNGDALIVCEAGCNVFGIITGVAIKLRSVVHDGHVQRWTTSTEHAIKLPNPSLFLLENCTGRSCIAGICLHDTTKYPTFQL